MSSFLVTGVAGFLGSFIAEELVKQGHKVRGIDSLIGGYLDNVPQGVDFHQLDLNDLNEIQPIFKDVNTVVHAACTAYEGLSVFSPALIVRNTVQITTTVLSASVKAGVDRFIYLSSMARYGNQEEVPFRESFQTRPQDPYGIAKVASEDLVINISKTHGMDYVILVPHNIIGPRQKYDDPYRNVASIMINRMLQGKQPIIYGSGEQKRCFSFIVDTLPPIMKSCFVDNVLSEVINIGPDEEFVTINTLAQMLADILDFKLNPIYMPGRPQEVFHANCSADKARDLLGYKTTTTLRQGLEQLATWIQSRGPKPFEYHLPLEFVTDKTPKSWSEKLM